MPYAKAKAVTIRFSKPSWVDKFSGGFVERETPVPIPNTEVKPLGADGTALEAAWESRKPPGLFFAKARESVKLSRAFSLAGANKSPECGV